MLARTFLVDRAATIARRRAIHAGPDGRFASSAHRGPRGFTLIEALVAVVLIGMGAVAVIMAAGSGTQVNKASLDMTQASFLAQELHEWTVRLPIDDPNSTNDLTAMDDAIYGPPVDGSGNEISNMVGWSQEIVVTWRNPSDLDSVVADGGSYVVYVEVTIKRYDRKILTTGWLIVERS